MGPNFSKKILCLNSIYGWGVSRCVVIYNRDMYITELMTRSWGHEWGCSEATKNMDAASMLGIGTGTVEIGRPLGFIDHQVRSNQQAPGPVNNLFSEKKAEGMESTRWLRVLQTLADNVSSVPSTHVKCLLATWNFRPRVSITFMSNYIYSHVPT